MLPKIIVLLGQTASGKSALAAKLAKKLNGEIISADSRQVYKGLDIGTGKITKKEMRGIRHHLLDVVSHSNQFSVSDYKRLADLAIKNIIKKGKLPIVCGGTALYIDALLGKIDFPHVKPNIRLRKQLESKPKEELFIILLNLDPKRAKEIDKNNPRRLIRAIEIAVAIGPNFAKASRGKAHPKYDAIKLGIKIPEEELKKRINKRLKERIKKGMINEAKRLHESGMTYKRMRELGLEYRRLADFLENKIDKAGLTSLLEREIWQYAKRQNTWWKRDKEVIWIEPKLNLASSKIKRFL